MIELFLFNAWAIALFSIVMFINLCCVAKENFSGAFGLTILFLGGIWFFHQNPFTWIWNNPDKAFYCSLVYLALGFFYSLMKYKNFLKKEKLKSSFDPRDHTPEKHKGDIIGWMFWWPFSLIGYLIIDFLAEIADKAFEVVKSAFDRIYNKAIGSK